MPQMHVKGRLLQLLAEEGPQWDYELAARLASEYGERDTQYWHDSIRLTLADLTSGGLVYAEEQLDTVDTSRTFGLEKLVRHYVLSDFGRQRADEMGLLREPSQI